MAYPWHWNHFFDKYPYTDFHELNLDWLIDSIKYWYKRVDYVQQAIATGSEDHNKYYEYAHKSGDLIWWNDEFYRLTKDVAAGDNIDCHSLEHISVEDLLDEETAARIAADNALDDRIDKEITDRTNADNNLQEQITNHEGRITTLETCCDDAKKTLADHETRITNNTTNITNLTNRVTSDETTINNIDKRVTNNTTNITNLTNQINNGTSASGERDTNTLTQLTYHEWQGTIWGGTASNNNGVTELSCMQEVANKVNEIINNGGHAELCRVQLYGGSQNNAATMGLNGSNFLNSTYDYTNNAWVYRYSHAGGSIVDGDCGISDRSFSSVAADNVVRNWYYVNGDNWTYHGHEDLTTMYYSDDTSIKYWQYRIVYQTADYISAT